MKIINLELTYSVIVPVESEKAYNDLTDEERSELIDQADSQAWKDGVPRGLELKECDLWDEEGEE